VHHVKNMLSVVSLCRLGGPALGRLPAEDAGDQVPSGGMHNTDGRTSHSSPGGVGGIRGMSSSFGAHHPEPLLFDVASDFKV